MPLVSQQEIGTGMPYPPERESSRVTMQERWFDYSHRYYNGLTPTTTTQSQLQFSIAGRTQPFRLGPNFFRSIMDFWANAVITDEPVIEYASGGRQQQFIDAMRTPLFTATRRVVEDFIRYGMGLFWTRTAMIPESLDPRFWFPVRDPGNVYQSGGVEIVAYPYQEELNAGTDRLYVWRTGGGETVEQRYKLSSLTIDDLLVTRVMPGVPGLITPIRSREGFYGTSDFEDIAEYVSELHRRESGISEALDRHVNPHLAVPEGSLQANPDGSVTLSADGMVIPIPDGGEHPAYVTWDAQFEAHEHAIDRAELRILQMVKIAPILVTLSDKQSYTLPSGAALRRLAIPTLNRLLLIRAALTDAFKDVIVANAMLYAAQGGELIDIQRDAISIVWGPPLSSGLTDEADAFRALIESGAMTRETALQLVEKVSRGEAQQITSQGQVNNGTEQSD